jgi:hypothetical protein
LTLISLFKENKSIRPPTKRNTRLTKTTSRPPCTDMTITTPIGPAESPNKMTTRSQVRSSNNTSLNCSVDTEISSKRDRQRKSQSNYSHRTPGLHVICSKFIRHVCVRFCS